jgi:3-oxoacyl-[acyl-carrier-protein] synthase II
MRFMKRVLEKGAGFASPADFPNLVPSSPVSHAAIYLGLGGPALAAPDLSATAESSIATGLDLVAAGLADGAVAGSVEEVSDLAERVLAPLLGVRPLKARGEGASGVAIERAASAASRGKRPLARVTAWSSARGARAPELPPLVDGTVVVAEPGVDVGAIVGGTAWADAPRLVTRAEAGDHVGLGGVAFAAAAAKVARDGVAALVVGAAPDRAYAFLLEPAP